MAVATCYLGLSHICLQAHNTFRNHLTSAFSADMAIS